MNIKKIGELNKIPVFITEQKKDAFEQFAEKRFGGAEKITKNAKEKGGPALLTYHHFKVKLPYYENAIEGDFDVESSKKEYKKLLKQLVSATKDNMNITQTEFQELVGKLEVVGELLIKKK